MTHTHTLEEIKALATRIAEEERPKVLSDAVLLRQIDHVANLMYEQTSDDEEFKIHRTEYNARKKDREKAMRQVLTDIRNKQTIEKQKVFYVPDFDAGKMYVYNEHGDLLEHRRLRPEERQTAIHQLPNAKVA